MTQATHTPGPWRIGDAGATVFGPRTDAPSPVTIASLGRNNSRANANLIVAAPELLAVLEMGLYWLEQQEEHVQNDQKTYMDVARATIAKAKGVQGANAKGNGYVFVKFGKGE